MSYIVVENAGYEGEREVKQCREYHTAINWLKRNYSSDEIDSLHVAICCDLPNGDRSYEI